LIFTEASMPNEDFTAALGRVPSGIFVLTCRGSQNEIAMLVSWVQQCSFDPPMVSVAIRKGREVADLLIDGASFAVNILAEGQKELLAHFGKGSPLEHLPQAHERVHRPEGLGAVLHEALGVLHCQVAGGCEAGDHYLILGRVVGGSLHSEERPMIHVRKSGMNY
jgi:flavin reductase (DIM6/NTAB) family NADH-FMN oxidoreductase RutF